MTFSGTYLDLQEILFEFRAGKMMTNGTRVTPDPRKGLVRLSKVGHLLSLFFYCACIGFSKTDWLPI